MSDSTIERPKSRCTLRTITHAVLALGLVTHSLWAQEEPPKPIARPSDLIDLSLTDLMNLEVTSVSRRSELLSGAPASVFVITREMIRRAGVTTLPEALRLAPNLHVARVSASAYAITARGFNNSAANKLLVLIDGRSVYTPLFSGVFWDAQDVLLEDIERIEVISGPGGTLWGTNAVNGVVNVITRSARQTEGGYAEAGAGNQERNAAARYGGALGSNGSYRLYGKYLHHDHTSTENGTAKEDAWHKVHAGFRTDWERGDDHLSVHGNAYRGSIGQPLPGSISIMGTNLTLGTISISGVNLVSRWSRQREDGSGLTLQAYYDRTERTVPPTFAEDLDIIDVQAQLSLRPIGMHRVTWGAEYRHGRDRVTNSVVIAFLPAKLDQNWAALFGEDEMTLRDDVKLTLGVRAERNDYTGVEFLPSARLGWKVAPDHLLWTAASRTVRAPSRLDRDTFVPGNPPFLLTGGPDVRSEIATVYEIGYRAQAAPSLTYSIAAYHAVYDHLRTQEVAPSRTSVFFANGMKGTTTGLEIWGAYQPLPRWRLSGGFTALNEELRLREGSNDLLAPVAQEGRDPAQSWRLSSSLDLPHNGELEVALRHVGELSRPLVPGYTTADLRYGWRPGDEWEFSLTGRNIFGEHAEFTDLATRTRFERSVFFKISRLF